MRVLRLLIVAILMLVLASVADAAASTAETTPTTPAATKIKLTAAQTKLLWATVNICDTDAHPNTIGIAGSMPLIKQAKQLYMRFRVQYKDESTGAFKYIPEADSDWEIVDPGQGKARTAGHDFELATPKTKDGYVVRAEISFQWRKGKKVVLSTKRLTSAKHPKTVAADPKHFSAALCTIAA